MKVSTLFSLACTTSVLLNAPAHALVVTPTLLNATLAYGLMDISNQSAEVTLSASNINSAFSDSRAAAISIPFQFYPAWDQPVGPLPIFDASVRLDTRLTDPAILNVTGKIATSLTGPIPTAYGLSDLTRLDYSVTYEFVIDSEAYFAAAIAPTGSNAIVMPTFAGYADFLTKSDGQQWVNLDSEKIRIPAGTYSYTSYIAGSNNVSDFRVGTGQTNFNVIISAVPEPSSWAMMFVGFALVGAALRYRERPRAADFVA